MTVSTAQSPLSISKPLSKEAQEELALILAEEIRRRKESPIEFLEDLPIQAKFSASEASIILLFGGNRCLGGECEIYDPVLNIKRRVDSIDEDFFVEAWDNGQKVIARASRPFRKDVDDLYNIRLSNGQSFVASLGHVVLTPYGYHTIFDALLKFGGVLQASTSECDQLARVSDETRCQKIVEGSRVGCRPLSYSDGGLLQMVRGNVPAFVPSLAGAQERISSEAYGQKDGSGSKEVRSRLGQLFYLRSNQDDLRRFSGRCAGILCRAFYTLYKSALRLRLIEDQSKIASFLRRSIVEFVQRGNCSYSTSPYDKSFPINTNLAITSIGFNRRDVKWDFTVPKYHNYILGGTVHHNSGKTTPVSKRVLRSGLDKRLKIWVCGETFSDSVAIQQKKISELVPRQRVKYGSYDPINGYTNRKLLLDNGTMYTFKSYDQGRTAFQSDDIDIIWCDEEPPNEIIKEMRMRLVDRNGVLIISMTSLKGITELIADLYEDCDVLESRYAPLVKKELPVHARKGPVEIFFLWTTDNIHIDQSRLMDEVALMPEQDILCRIYGMPTNLAGKIYMSFNRAVHVISSDDVPVTGNQLWNVLDPHDRKPWAIGFYCVNKNGSVYCVDEYPNQSFTDMLYDDRTYEDYAKLIKEKEARLRERFNIGGKVRRVIDPNFGNKTVQMAERIGGQSKTTPVKELAKLGLKYKDGIDSLEAGHLEVRRWLHWVRKDGQLVVAPGIYFADNCENHINGLGRYSRKDTAGVDGDVKDRVAPQDKYKDFPDLVRYFLMANPRWIEEREFIVSKERTY